MYICNISEENCLETSGIAYRLLPVPRLGCDGFSIL